MTAVPVAGKAATFVILTVLAFGGQDPPAAEKPKPGPPTIRLPIERLKPDASIDLAGERQMTSGDGTVWASSRESGNVVRVDTKTNKVTATVAAGKAPCGGLTIGFGSLVVPLCGAPGLARIDLKTNAVTSLSKGFTASMTEPVTGVGSIWIVGDDKGTLMRIDPASNAIVAAVPLGAKARALAFGQGALWVATDAGELLRINPYTIVTDEIIKVGKSPRSIAVGEGAVWTLNAGDGAVSRVDPKTNKVVTTIKLGGPVTGGQIAAGEGSVWVTAPGAPLSRIDPRTNRLVQQFMGEGGGAVLVAQGSVWLAATSTTIWRLDPRLIEATR